MQTYQECTTVPRARISQNKANKLKTEAISNLTGVCLRCSTATEEKVWANGLTGSAVKPFKYTQMSVRAFLGSYKIGSANWWIHLVSLSLDTQESNRFTSIYFRFTWQSLQNFLHVELLLIDANKEAVRGSYNISWIMLSKNKRHLHWENLRIYVML